MVRVEFDAGFDGKVVYDDAVFTATETQVVTFGRLVIAQELYRLGNFR